MKKVLYIALKCHSTKYAMECTTQYINISADINAFLGLVPPPLDVWCRYFYDNGRPNIHFFLTYIHRFRYSPTWTIQDGPIRDQLLGSSKGCEPGDFGPKYQPTDRYALG